MLKETTLDVRGLSCPVPLLKVQKALQESGNNSLVILSDCATAKENISRFLDREGYSFTISQSGGNLQITVHKK